MVKGERTYLSSLINTNLYTLFIYHLDHRIRHQRARHPRVFIVIPAQRVSRYASGALRHAVALLAARTGEAPLEEGEHLGADGGGAGSKALDAGEVVCVHHGVIDEADEERRDELDLGDAVGGDGGEEGGHAELGHHDDGGGRHKGEYLHADDARD